MQLSEIWRHLQTRSGRQALAGMVLLSLACAAQPCAMAESGPVEPHCPHCPPAEPDHEPHCDEAVEPACHDLDQIKPDGRGKDLPAAASASSTRLTAQPRAQYRSRPPPHCQQPGAPPLNILHCVYLN